MPRTQRMLIDDQSTVYHVMSRTALDGFPLGDIELEKERKKEFELSKTDRFRYCTRYFSDSGFIGSKEFESTNYQRFRNLFSSKHEKKPKPIKGLDGIYSLKRLSELI